MSLHAATVARALDRWHASLPDVVLLDLSLPGVDGLEVLAQRARRRLEDAGADPDRARHGRRPHPRPEHRRRRLPAQALRSGRARGTHPCAVAPRAAATARRAPGASTCSRASSAACAAKARAERCTFVGSRWSLRRASSRCCARCWPSPRHAVAKERLFELVFPGESHVQAEAIEVVAYRLRKKLAHTGAQLVTLRGLGYLLKAQG